MVLAARFGGTPWEWRREKEPDERDIYTALWLLEHEQEELREVQDGVEEHDDPS